MIYIAKFNQQIGQLESIANNTYQLFEEAVKTNSNKIIRLANSACNDLSQTLEKSLSEDLKNAGTNGFDKLSREGNIFDRYILTCTISAVPILKLLKNHKIMTREYPDVNIIKSAIDDRTISYNKIGDMSHELARAGKYNSILEVTKYVLDKPTKPVLIVDFN